MSTALARSEESRLVELEATIERGFNTFVEVGAALMEIRESGLYGAEYGTFENYCKQRWSLKQSRAYQLMDAAKTVGILQQTSTMVELPATERVARELASISEPDRVREVWAETVDRHGPEPTATEVREVARGKMGIHYSSESPEWYTPPQIVTAVLAALGEIDLDPCSNPPPHNIPARRHFTAVDDGLGRQWSGRVYMNPPYGEEIGKWTEKLRLEYEDQRRVSSAIALVPARTDTAWFRALRKYPRCFVSGRLKFSDAATSAPFPSALLYFGTDVNEFANAFAGLGDTYTLHND